jgi:hypothetical protein
MPGAEKLVAHPLLSVVTDAGRAVGVFQQAHHRRPVSGEVTRIVDQGSGDAVFDLILDTADT